MKEGEKEKGTRRIFEGQVEFDEFEKQKLKELQVYLDKKLFQPQQWWNDSRKLRFLQATGFKMDKTYKTMETHQEWRKQSIPPKMTSEIQEFLQRGAFYVHGRDHRFRPVLVINVKRFDFQHIKINLILESMTFYFEYILSNMMLPGQIENWVVLLDLGNIGLSSLPITGLKQIMGYLSSNYRSRMYVTYVLNTPASIFIPYKIVKGFLEESTIKKINFYNNGNPIKLFTHCHPSQIEQVYHGTAPTLANNFWVPRTISNQYQANDRHEPILQSRQEYNKRYLEGKLENNVTLIELLDTEPFNNLVHQDTHKIFCQPHLSCPLISEDRIEGGTKFQLDVSLDKQRQSQSKLNQDQFKNYKAATSPYFLQNPSSYEKIEEIEEPFSSSRKQIDQNLESSLASTQSYKQIPDEYFQENFEQGINLVLIRCKRILIWEFIYFSFLIRNSNGSP